MTLLGCLLCLVFAPRHGWAGLCFCCVGRRRCLSSYRSATSRGNQNFITRGTVAGVPGASVNAAETDVDTPGYLNSCSTNSHQCGYKQILCCVGTLLFFGGAPSSLIEFVRFFKT